MAAYKPTVVTSRWVMWVELSVFLPPADVTVSDAYYGRVWLRMSHVTAGDDGRSYPYRKCIRLRFVSYQCFYTVEKYSYATDI